MSYELEKADIHGASCRPVLQDGMLLATRRVVSGDIGHPPLSPKEVARLLVYG